MEGPQWLHRITLSFLEMRKLKPQMEKGLTQGHTANYVQSGD